MSMFGEKKPLFFDLNKGHIGTYEAFHKHISEAGIGFPVFVPLNGIRKVRYPDPIPQECVKSLSWPDQNGNIQQWTFVINGKEGLLGMLFANYDEQVRQLQEQKRTLEIEIRQLKQKVRSAGEGLNKSMAEVESITKRRQENTNVLPGSKQFLDMYNSL